MIELLALWLLGRGVAATADAKRRDRGWVALVFITWIGVELLVWSLARSLGLAALIAYPVALMAGAASGFAMVAILRSLPPLPAFDPRRYDDTWSEATCPQCGSEQTYASANKVRCFVCDYYGEPVQGRPRSRRPSARPRRAV